MRVLQIKKAGEGKPNVWIEAGNNTFVPLAVLLSFSLALSPYCWVLFCTAVVLNY